MKHNNYYYTKFFELFVGVVSVVLVLGGSVGCGTSSKKLTIRQETSSSEHAQGVKTDGKDIGDVNEQVLSVKKLLDEGQSFEAQRLAVRLASQPDIKWQALYRLSRYMANAGLYQHMIQVLEKASDVTHSSPPLLLYLCAAYGHFQFFDEAAQICHQALRLAKKHQLPARSPKFFQQILLFNSKMAYHRGKREDLERWLGQILDVEPMHCESRYLLSKSFYRNKHFNKSLDQFGFMDKECRAKYPRSVLLQVMAFVKSGKKEKAVDLVAEMNRSQNEEVMDSVMKTLQKAIDNAISSESRLPWMADLKWVRSKLF